ncbi:MAG: hypothetical protein WAW79_00055, partial [Steroidobacteraceae bacterium]
IRCSCVASVGMLGVAHSPRQHMRLRHANARHRIGWPRNRTKYSYVWNNPLTLIDPSGFQAAPPDVVTQGQPRPRQLCPWRIANIGLRCQYRYGWRWDLDPYYLWLLDEYLIEAWARQREARGGLSEQQPGSPPGGREIEDLGVGNYAVVDRQFWQDILDNAIQEVVLDSIESARGTYAACTGGALGKCAWDVADLVCEVGKVCDGLSSWGKNTARIGDIIKESRVARKSGSRSRDLPPRGVPNSSAAVDKGDGKGTIRDYGPDGRAKTDYDFGHDHPTRANPQGAGDPHAHDWDWSKPSRERQPPRPLNPGE